jgi:hypothetical protein
MKKNIFFTCIVALSFNVVANEVIKITWAGGGGIPKIFSLTATANFTIDWGDGTIETKTGGWQQLTHYYDSFDSFQAIITGSSTGCLFTTVVCNGTRITGLDLSGCTALKILNCGANQLKNLDVSKCVKLKELDCYTNQLSSLDLSANIALTHVWCFENKLSSLDVSGCTALIQLSCSGNRLTSLDLSTNIALEVLGCPENQLSSLDFSNNPSLRGFSCENNQISSINTGNILAFERIDCYNNRLPLSDLYKYSKMISDPFYRFLGTQTFVAQTIAPGSSVDFSSQAEFEGVATVFEVQKDGLPATIGVDYTISGGIIKFNNDGKYTVTMTNSAIVVTNSYSAKVIAEFWVGIEGIDSTTLGNQILVYPNPTTGKVYIKVENGLIPEIKLYSTDGKLLQQVRSVEIDMTDYPTGVYYLQIEEKMMKIIKSK